MHTHTSSSHQLHCRVRALTCNANNNFDRILFLAIQFLSQTHHTCITIDTEHWSRYAVSYGATIWIDACRWQNSIENYFNLFLFLFNCLFFGKYRRWSVMWQHASIRRTDICWWCTNITFQIRIIRFIMLFRHTWIQCIIKIKREEKQKKNTISSMS